jgi:hypothetical protein
MDERTIDDFDPTIDAPDMTVAEAILARLDSIDQRLAVNEGNTGLGFLDTEVAIIRRDVDIIGAVITRLVPLLDALEAHPMVRAMMR